MVLASRIGRGLAAAVVAALGVGAALRPAPAAAETMPTPAMAPIGAEFELILVEQPGCRHGARWTAEVMPTYAQSAEGRAAPLRRVPLDGPWPDGLVLGARPAVTPTFILVRAGQEVSRLEGYPGEGRFWPLLRAMLSGAGAPLP